MEGWIAAALLAAGTVFLWARWQRLARAEFIRSYAFPRGLLEKLQTRRPALDAKQLQLVARALRQFFLAHLHSGRQFVSMPLQVTDDLWHEFILYTRHYDAFCRRAFGRFMHHTPAVALGAVQQNNDGLKRTWRHACQEENINPRKPTRLPLLFALDAKLGISDGFTYSLDCSNLQGRQSGTVHCAADIACGGGCAGDSGCGGGGCGGD
jgi:hypothetical protein